MVISNRFARTFLIALCLSIMTFGAGPGRAVAQESIKVSGEAFGDYYYIFSSLNGDVDGENAFTYRRARLTTDMTISETFSGRLRLEATDQVGTASSIPTPYIKDLFLKWNDALGKGHYIVMGVSPTVAWQPVEKVWGYRSLAPTLQDRAGVHSSRDLGVSFFGPLAGDGKLKYAMMIANGNSLRAENNKYKRLYGQLEFYPNKQFAFTFGGFVEGFSDGYIYNVNAFAGYTGNGFRLGTEGYFNPVVYDDNRPNAERYAGSVFLVYDTSEKNSIILRADVVERPDDAVLPSQAYALAGFAFKPHKNVQFIPNVIYIISDGADQDSIAGRATLWFKF